MIERLIHVEEKLDGSAPEMIERLMHVEEKLDGKTSEIIQRLVSVEEKENDIANKWDKTGNIRIKLKGLN